MLTLKMDMDWEHRLAVAARRLGRAPEECAISAIKSFVVDCEDAAALSRKLSGGEAVMRPPDEFYD